MTALLLMVAIAIAFVIFISSFNKRFDEKKAKNKKPDKQTEKPGEERAQLISEIDRLYRERRERNKRIAELETKLQGSYREPGVQLDDRDDSD